MIRVLVVDDSAIVRQLLESKLNNFGDLEVIGTAQDPYIAREMIVNLKPDVLTLDIEMPRMDGLTFLRKLMDYYPIPVIIVSSVTTRDDQAAFKALQIGAFDVVNKPSGSITVEEVIGEIVRKIRSAYKLKNSFLSRRKIMELVREKNTKIKIENLSKIKTTGVFIAIGCSTGGTIALEYILSNLPSYLPPILVVQHMPINYTEPFAKRLNEVSALTVKESRHSEVIQSGHVYIAKAGLHMKFQRRGTSSIIVHNDSEKVSYQKPAVDVLFSSMAEKAGKNVLALILTGMGEDGAKGLLKLKEKGAITVAQDEKTSIVYGMPLAAKKIGAAKKILPLDEIPKEIVNFSLSNREL